MPAPPKSSASFASATAPVEVAPKAMGSMDAIVAKNLFDPERGAGASRDAEENSRAAQRVRNMVLVGTTIFGNDKLAIVQDGVTPGAGPRVPGQSQSATPMRLRIGDSVDGFRLTEIAEKRVVFSSDASRIEVMLDYLRKTEVPQPRPATPRPVATPGGAAPQQPQVVPNLPRRARIPVPPNQRPDS